MKKSVLVYAGPPASGKTTNMKKFAEIRGIHFCRISWPSLKLSMNSYWKYLQKDPEGIEYLFIDEYDLADFDSNYYLHELSESGIMIVLASQTIISNEIRETLPVSFRITRCSLMAEEVAHA